METKHQKFKRLAELRGNRILHNIRLLSNLSNTGNYEYTEAEVRILFTSIEQALKMAKHSFANKKKHNIEL